MSEGLLSGVLPFIFSQGDRLKRNINGWINDPAAKAEQTAGILYDTLNEQTRLQNQAFGDPKNPLKITDQRAFEAATNGILNGVMGFAPAGMTKLVGPQAQAMETARKNAVQMLGLAENNTAMDRAKALGFNTEAYHGTTRDFPAFDKAKRGSSTDPGWYGPGEYTAPKPSGAEAYTMASWPDYRDGANIMPLLARNPEPIVNKFGNVTEYVTREPNQLRSRFAAFDPARVKDNDLLAGMLPLGALSGVSAVPPDFLKAPEKKKKEPPKK